MKAALIAPVPMLRALAFGSLHLILDDILHQYPSYRAYYRQRSIAGDWVILDNSAHEQGHGNDHAGLLKRAIMVGASELVCPDELFSDTGTINRTAHALQYFKDNVKALGKTRLMMVPQAPLGTGSVEYQDGRMKWNACLNMLCSMHTEAFQDRPFTIGISKDYELWPGGLDRLLHRYVVPLRTQYPFEVHLLGWGRQLDQLNRLNQTYPWIRSTDSAKPYVYAHNYIPIDTLNPQPYPGRPQVYFDRVFNQAQTVIAYYNAFVFKKAAGDTLLSNPHLELEGMRLEGFDTVGDIWKS